MENLHNLFSEQEGEDAGESIDSLRKLLEKLASSVKKAFSYASGTIKYSLRDVQKTVSASSGALKRTVASFDQLNRLKAPTGGGLSAAEKKAIAAREAAQALVEKLQSLGQSEVVQPLEELAGHIQNVTQAFLEGDLPTFNYIDRIRSAIREMDSLRGAGALVSGTLEGMTVPMELAGRAVKTLAEQFPGLTDAFASAAEKAGLSAENVREIWNPIASWMETQVIAPVRGRFQDLWDRVGIESLHAKDGVEGTFSQTAQSVAGAFSKAWQEVKGAFDIGGNVFDTLQSGILGQFTGAVNGLIDGINSVVSIPFTGLNNALNRLTQVDILGTKPFSSLSWRPSVPKIPHLAQGAVLPANKPFLAVVGDQHRGTNVEAPLSTIQEAVSLVMEDAVKSNLAGHEATVRLLGQILEAVLSIEVGDAVIGRAYDRYAKNQYVMGGGQY